MGGGGETKREQIYLAFEIKPCLLNSFVCSGIVISSQGCFEREIFIVAKQDFSLDKALARNDNE